MSISNLENLFLLKLKFNNFNYISTKSKIKIIKDKKSKRIMFRSRVKWHEEGEKNNAYFLGLMNSKYTKLNPHKITDEEGTDTDKIRILRFYPPFPLLGGGTTVIKCWKQK